MTLPTAPLPIDRLFDRPGNEWSAADCTTVKAWLCEEKPLRVLLLIAHRYGWARPGAEAAEFGPAEEVWAEFYVRRLDSCLERYDPRLGLHFYRYLPNRFNYFCRERAKAERQHRALHPPLEPESIACPDPGPDTERIVASNQLRDALNRCVESLAEPNRTIIVLFYQHKQSVDQIAFELKLSPVNVRVRLCRARRNLRDRCTREDIGLEDLPS